MKRISELSNIAIMDDGKMFVGVSEEFITTYSHRIRYFFENSKDLLENLNWFEMMYDELKSMQEAKA